MPQSSLPRHPPKSSASAQSGAVGNQSRIPASRTPKRRAASDMTHSNQPQTSGKQEATLDWLDPELVGKIKKALASRQTFPDEKDFQDSGQIELIQTHISSVLLTPAYVFKFKRPLDVGFADFHTLEQRKQFCQAEIRLNRRLAEDVYLGVLPLCTITQEHRNQGDRNQGYRLGEGGPVVDYCVVMRRLSSKHMLDYRVKHGKVNQQEIQALASLLVEFHTHPENRENLSQFGGENVIRQNWEENFAQTRPFIGKSIDETTFHAIQTAVEAYMVRNRTLWETRVKDGYIRDGHGDLRCEHIYFGGEGLRIIDCIEFNDRFRFGDVANDLAFLLMDLVALGKPGLSQALLQEYTALSGDRQLARLVPFYACYRAYVRGKVTSFKLNDTSLPASKLKQIRASAQRFFKLSLEFSRQMPPPLLVLVCGLMGTGKSVLAQSLTEHTGLPGFNSDIIRKQLAREHAHDTTGEGSQALERQEIQGKKTPFAEGIYSAEWNQMTYARLFKMGAEALSTGQSVILDASFSRRADREKAMNLAHQYGARAVLIECRLSEPETRARLLRRSKSGDSISDGRDELYTVQKARFETIEEWPEDTHLVVETNQPPSQLVDKLRAHPAMTLPKPLFSNPE